MRSLRSGPARLLVVDDNKVNRLLLGRSLELQGHSVASAENGRVALEMLRREAFDLLLLDIEMPEMNGFQVLEQLVNDLQLRDLPVIVTSSLEGLDNVQLITMRMANRIQPGIAVKAGGIDDQCVSFPAPNRMTKPAGYKIAALRMAAPVEIHQMEPCVLLI